MIACYLAGADIVDVATDAMSGVTSQPSMGAVLNSLPTPSSQFDQDKLVEINNYWEQVGAPLAQLLNYGSSIKILK